MRPRLAARESVNQVCISEEGKTTSTIERATSLLTGEGRTDEQPVGTIHLVNPSPLSWLYITYNAVEELVRTDKDGSIVPAAMKSYS